MKQMAAMSLLGVAALIHATDSTAAQLPVAQCQTLYAGKSIDAGDVCVTNDSTHLYVTYKTTGDWYLDDVHLFVGTSLTEMPATRTGNPKIGNFPYVIEDLDSKEHTFRIPLGDLSAADPCASPKALALAAHAALVRHDAAGTVYQTDTGWGNGNQLNVKGSWAMSFSYRTQCPPTTPDGPVTYSCETAFALGGTTFIDLGLTDKRWGWQITIKPGTSDSAPIYAGAGQNDLSKGTYVGDLVYTHDGANLTLVYQMYDGWVMKATHVYAGANSVETIAPGQYGNQHGDLDNTTSDSYTLAVSGNPIFVVAHAEACIAR